MGRTEQPGASSFEIAYDLSSWSDDAREALVERVGQAGVAMRWVAYRLVVPARRSTEVDEAIAAVVAAPEGRGSAQPRPVTGEPFGWYPVVPGIPAGPLEPAASSGGLPVPGWYHDGTGLRWWDGATWGPYAPPGSGDPVSKGKALAVLSHLGLFTVWFILPLVIRLTEGRHNSFVKHHSTEALNFMITFGVVWNGLGLSLVLYSSTSDSRGTAPLPAWFFVAFAVLGVAFLLALVWSILGAVRAGQGVWWRYPLSLRLVSGALRAGETPPTEQGPETTTGGPETRTRRRVWPWAVAGVLVIVVVGGFVAAFVSIISDVGSSSQTATERSHAISTMQFDSVPLGASRSQTIAQLGRTPQDPSDFVDNGILDSARPSCIYYNQRGQDFGPGFEFCFRHGLLHDKHAFCTNDEC